MFDNETLSIPCPQCGQKADKTIGWIKMNDSYTCAGCDRLITLDKQQLITSLDSAQKSIDQLALRLTKFGKRR